MNLQPINDRILVRLFEHPNEEQKIGSIIVPEIAREKENICGNQMYLDKPFHKGEVVAIGPGALVELTCKRCGDEKIVRREMSVKVGDTVLFGRFFDMMFDNLVMLREDDLLGVEEAEHTVYARDTEIQGVDGAKASDVGPFIFAVPEWRAAKVEELSIRK